MIVFKELEDIKPLKATIPPQMDEADFEEVKAQGETVTEGMQGSMFIFILSQLLLGGILSKLIGTI